MKTSSPTPPSLRGRALPGQRIESVTLPRIDGSMFDLSQVAGKRYLLSFFRFASCPFCNLRLHELVKASQGWPSDFSVIAVFDSSLQNLQRHAAKHQSPFPILADSDNRYYRAFSVERSWGKTLKGAILRFPRVLHALFAKGYWPTSFGGKLHTLPLDILVDENGMIVRAHYGEDEGDHIDLEDIQRFTDG